MENFSRNNYLLHVIQSEKEKRRKKEADKKRILNPNLKPTSDALDDYYFVNKLSLYCAHLSYENIVQKGKIDYNADDFVMIKEILKHIEFVRPSNPTIIIYNKIRILFESIHKDSVQLDQLFSNILNLINEHEKLHSVAENLEMYSLLNNYCIRKINERRNTYKKIFLEINNHMINLRFDEDSEGNTKLELGLFKNIVIAAITLEDQSLFKNIKTFGLTPPHSNTFFQNAYEWAEQFISFYGDRLERNTQTNAYHQYCSAFLEFKRKNFMKAYKILSNSMRIQGVFLNLDFKILHLKVLYEIITQKPDILEYDKIEIRKILDAYRKLVDVEEVEKRRLSYQLSYYIKFKETYRKLLNLFYKYNGRLDNQRNSQFLKKKTELIEFISQEKYSFNFWFLEKLNKIK